jgi:hypothetical protein
MSERCVETRIPWETEKNNHGPANTVIQNRMGPRQHGTVVMQLNLVDPFSHWNPPKREVMHHTARYPFFTFTL